MEVPVSEQPLVNGANGRAAGGQFAPGNPGGPGNPHVKRTAALRAAMLEAVTEDDMKAIVKNLVELAKGGDLAAAKELFDRVFGKAPAAAHDVVEHVFPNQSTAEERRAMYARIAARLGVNLDKSTE